MSYSASGEYSEYFEDVSYENFASMPNTPSVEVNKRIRDALITAKGRVGVPTSPNRAQSSGRRTAKAVGVRSNVSSKAVRSPTRAPARAPNRQYFENVYENFYEDNFEEEEEDVEEDFANAANARVSSNRVSVAKVNLMNTVPPRPAARGAMAVHATAAPKYVKVSNCKLADDKKSWFCESK